MASSRLVLAALVVFATLAGCASSEQNTIDSLYTNDAVTVTLPPGLPGIANGTTLTIIEGQHLETRINDGAWGHEMSFNATIAPFASPAMTGPSSTGGGGETTMLPAPSNLTLEVRIEEYAQLSGYTAWWVYTGANGTTAPVSRPADDLFEVPLGVGPYRINVLLSKSASDPTPVAVYNQTIAGSVSATWSVTGEVQPVHAANAPGDRASMVDKYTFEFPEGVVLTATSSFDGTFAPGDGTDVDLGIYGIDGTGLACAGSGGSPTPVVGGYVPDPAQASETVTYDTDDAGTWSFEVGRMAEGCSGQTLWTYSNAGPVPYSVVITATAAA